MVQKVAGYEAANRTFETRREAVEHEKAEGRMRAIVTASGAATSTLRSAMRSSPRTRVGESEGVRAVREYVRACLRGDTPSPLTYESLLGDDAYAPGEGEPTRERVVREVQQAANGVVRSARRALREHGFKRREDGDELVAKLAADLVR